MFAHLYGADLSYSNAEQADLRHTNMLETNLQGINFRGANLEGAKISNIVAQLGPLGEEKCYAIYNATLDNLQYDNWHGEGKESYKGGTLAEFKERIEVVYDSSSTFGKEYRGAIAYFEMLRGSIE